MRPLIVGYGSSGRVPPNTPSACFEAFDAGADAAAVDVCETFDGVMVVGNRRTLRLLQPRDVPSWPAIEGSDLGAVFGTGSGKHRVLRLETFLQAMGPLSIHLVLDGPVRGDGWESLVDVVTRRREGETAVLAPPMQLYDCDLPEQIRRIALLRSGEDATEVPRRGVDAVAAPARSLPGLGRLRLPKIALGCDTRSGLVAAMASDVAAVHTERPSWFRWAWTEPAPARL